MEQTDQKENQTDNIDNENVSNNEEKTNTKEKPDCCSAKPKKKPSNIWQGIAYGLIPHIGCIAFIIGAVLGVTVLMQFFRPLLMHRNFFYILILISLIFATLASIIYLKKNGFLSFAGMKRKWKYLATMYGSTVGINLVLFMIIFPLLANVSVVSATSPSPTGGVVGIDSSDLSSIKLKVDIPCPGHAPLISNELKTIDGVVNIKFSFPNNFDVTYDHTRASKEEMLSLEVFDEYKATVLEESAAAPQPVEAPADQPPASGCGCGGGTCGAEGGGSCCGGV